jgi:hypothetical protein
MTLDEAHRLALKILKEVMEEKVDENNIQLAQVSSSASSSINCVRLDFADSGFHRTGHPNGRWERGQV